MRDQVDINELWRRAIRCGLVPPEAPAQIELAYRQFKKLDESSVISAEQVADFLVDRQRWSEFQRTALLAPTPGVLRRGNHLIVAIETPPPLSRWIQVQRGYLAHIGSKIPTAKEHAKVHHPHLAPIRIEQIEGETAVLFAPGRFGPAKWSANAGPKMPRSASVFAAIHAAAALRQLHDAGLVHGSIAANRFWFDQDQPSPSSSLSPSPLLLRDPSGTTKPNRSLLDPLEPEESARFTSPELAIASEIAGAEKNTRRVLATPAGDVYALGRVIQWWAFGDEPSTANRDDPLWKILSLALKKDPAERVDAAALEQALSGLVAKSPGDGIDPVVVADANIASAAAEQPIRRRRRQRRIAPVVLAAMAMIVLAQTIYLVLVPVNAKLVQRQSRQRPSVSETDNRSRKPPALENATAQVAAGIRGKDAIASIEWVDDPNALYAPPNAPLNAPPSRDAAAGSRSQSQLSLAWFPPGPAIVTVIRPSHVLGRDQDENEPSRTVRTALGVEGTAALQQAIAQSGLGPEQIETLTAAAYPLGGRLRFLFRGVSTVSLDPAPSTWSGPAAANPVASANPAAAAKTNDDAPDDAVARFELASNRDIKIARLDEHQFLFGTNELVTAAVANRGETASLAPAVRQIADHISGDVDLAIFGNPNVLFSQGRQWIDAIIPAWQIDLRAFLVPDVAAMSIALHLSDEATFIETRLMPAAVETPTQLHRRTRAAMFDLPDIAASQTGGIVDDAPWSKLTNAYPAMMRFLVGGVRTGIDDGTVVANTYLPTPAAAQIGVAAILVANAPPKITSDETNIFIPQTIDEFLAVQLNVEIAQESLKAALQSVRGEVIGSLPSAAVVPSMEIVGGDLQIDGITQNQQIRDFKQASQTLADILTALCVSANTDKSVRSPRDAKQKLIWVVDQGKILITTRAAAAKKNYSIPAAFVPVDPSVPTDDSP